VLVERLFGDFTEGGDFDDTGVREQDIEPDLLSLDPCIEPVEIHKIRDITLDRFHIRPDFIDRATQLGLAAAGDQSESYSPRNDLMRSMA
jgi:hypothetical protein